MKTLRAMPVLQVSDIPRAVSFYQRAGFATLGAWDAEPGVTNFVIVQRGAVTLGLQLLYGPLRVNTHWGAYVYVDDAAALHAVFTEAGLDPSELCRHEDYSCDDFHITDPDGHMIAFGTDRSDEDGPGLGPDTGDG